MWCLLMAQVRKQLKNENRRIERNQKEIGPIEVDPRWALIGELSRVRTRE